MRRIWLSVLAGVLGATGLAVAPPAVAQTTSGPSAYAAEVLADEPIAYWNFDEGSGNVAFDQVSGINGSRNGPSWSTDTGVAGSTSALSFDGSNDYVWLGRPPALRSSNYTKEMWFRADTPPTGIDIFFRSRWYGTALQLNQAGGINAWYFPQCSGSISLISTSDNLVDDEWHHIVVTKDESDFIIYVDGIEAARGPGSAETCHSGGNMAIGRDGNFNGNYLNADMDEWAFYDKALSADRVLAHYCVGSGSAQPPCATDLAVDAGDDQVVPEGTIVQLEGLVAGGSGTPGEAPEELIVNATVRDFSGSHPDFERSSGNDRNMVEIELGADQNPVYAYDPPASSPTTSSKASFDQWYNDVDGTNITFDIPITLSRISDDPLLYQFDDSSFFPINGQGFGNEGRSSNFHFTTEIHERFTYRGGEVFSFRGDDDVWVFINDRRVIDLGGIHGAQSASVNLDAIAAQIGIEIGGVYTLDVFHAERRTSQSNFRMTTSIQLEDTTTAEYGWEVVSASGPPIQLIGADTLTPSFVAPDDGVYTLRLTATAGDDVVSDEVTVTVENVAPAVGAAAAPTADDGLVMVSAAITDPGILDTHSATVDWGDGSTTASVPAAVQGAGWASLQAGHVYASAGDYTITVTLFDDDGGTVTTTTALVEVGGGGVPQPEPGVALWGDNGSNGSNSVWLSGSGHEIIGTSHSNSKFRVTGSNHSFTGATEYERSISVTDSGTTFDPAAVEVDEAPFPVPYVIEDYMPGGRAALAAGASFFDMSAECGNKWSPSEPLEAGLYWVPCDVSITGSSFAQGPVTIASNDKITVTGSSKEFFGPFVDSVLFVTSRSGNNALRVAGSSSTFAGMFLAPEGEIQVTGSGHSFECGLLGDKVRISGSDTFVDAGRCGLSDPGGSISDGVDVAGPPLLVPDLTLDAWPSPVPVAPNAELSVTADVDNDGATLIVPGLVALANGGLGSVSVDAVDYELEIADPSGTFTTVASTADGTAVVTGLGAPATGAVYATDGSFVGSTIDVDAAGVWAVTIEVELDPALVAQILDPGQTVAVRNRITLVPSADLGVRQTTRFGGNIVDALRAAGADVLAADATFSSPQGVQGPEALGDLAPGASVSTAWTIDAAGVTAKQPEETESQYEARLRALDGQTVGGVVTAVGGSSVGAVYAPSAVALSSISAPVLSITGSVPAAVDPGETSVWPLTIVNHGSADATDLSLIVDSDGVTSTVVGLPTTLASGAVANVTVELVMPADASAAIPLSASLEWGDAAGNAYGTLSAAERSRVILPAALVVEKSWDVPPGTPSGQIIFQVSATNIGTDPITAVMITDTPDPGVDIVAGSVATSTGTIVSGNTGEATIMVDVGSLAGGESVLVDYLVDYTSLPPGQSTITNQATVTSAELPDVLSDDPSAPGAADPTIVDFGTPPTGGGGGDDGTSSGSAMIANVSPSDGATITEPTVVAVGDIVPLSGRTIESWRLVAYPAGAGPIDGFEVASAAGDPSNSVLDDFDPTMLSNGIWILRVEVTDSEGAISFEEVSVIVDGQLKLGRYAVTYQDVSLPVSGIPMQVLRTYDTIDRGESGDFGHGWNLELANFRVQTNRALGLGGWTGEGCGPGLIFVPLCFTPDTPRYVTVTWPDGETETFDFTPTGNTFFSVQMIPEFTARSGVTWSLAPADTSAGSLGSDGHMHSGGFGDGPVYDPDRFVLTAKDGTEYLLDVDDGLVSATDRNGNTVTIDAAGIHSSQGPEILFTRDGQGRITAVTDPVGNVTTYAYDAAGDLVSVTDGNGNVTTFGYIADHYLDEIDDPGPGPVQRREYDANGRLDSITDANGNVYALAADLANRTETATSPDGLLVNIVEYDARGNPVRSRHLFGGEVIERTATWDDRDRPLTLTSDSGTEIYVWDSDDNLVSQTSPSGVVSSSTYNAAGQPLITTVDGETASSYFYDANGNVTEVEFADGTSSTMTYGPAGRLATYTAPDGTASAFGYDGGGFLSVISGPHGTATYTNDANGRVTAVADSAGEAVTFAYDGNGNLLSSTDRNGVSESFAYDSRDRVQSATDKSGAVTSYSYDGLGNVSTATDRNGGVLSYTYDYRGNALSTSGAGVDVDFVYDAFGRLEGASTSETSLSFSYTSDHLLASETLDLRGETVGSVSYGYDADGLVTSVGSAHGATTYGYDPRGYLVSIDDSEAGLFSLTNDPTGRLETLTRPNGTVDTWTYDANGLPAALVSNLGPAVLVDLSISRDGAGRPVDVANGTSAVAMSYDAVGQLTSADYSGTAAFVNETFGYDANGNRTSWSGNPASAVTFSNDRLTEDTLHTYAYDAEGQLATKTNKATGVVTVYTWNLLGQLTAVTTSDGDSTTFAYDAIGRRVEVVHNGDASTFIHAGLNIAEELNGDGTLLRRFVTADGYDSLVATVEADDSVTFPVLDDQRTPIATLDSAGSVIATHEYDVFGNPTSPAAAVEPYTWTGLVADPTGLYYARNRYYDPTTGRAISEDPLPDVNLYAWANNSPREFVDPLGAAAATERGILSNLSTGIRQALVDEVGSYACQALVNAVLGISLQTSASPGTSNARGAAGEEFVENALGVNKNTDVFVVNNRSRIPDFVTDTHIVEVKNVDRLRTSQQLADYADLAKVEGKPLVIVTRQSTRMSRRVVETLSKKGITIVGCLPGF